MPQDWSEDEVEATVDDYLVMLERELRGVPYDKSEHRRALIRRLASRSEGAVEFKHQNISAVLIELGFPYIPGYKPRSNFQQLLYDVVWKRVGASQAVNALAAADADLPVVIPQLDDILAARVEPPTKDAKKGESRSRIVRRPAPTVNYLEREARNRNLGAAGEEFVLHYERARLISEGCARLALRVEHIARTSGDGAGFDVLSFDRSGDSIFIEVKTTKYGSETPFFVSRNEFLFSENHACRYHLYRVFAFRHLPRLFMLSGSLSTTCVIEPCAYLARVL